MLSKVKKNFQEAAKRAREARRKELANREPPLVQNPEDVLPILVVALTDICCSWGTAVADSLFRLSFAHSTALMQEVSRKFVLPQHHHEQRSHLGENASKLIRRPEREMLRQESVRVASHVTSVVTHGRFASVAPPPPPRSGRLSSVASQRKSAATPVSMTPYGSPSRDDLSDNVSKASGEGAASSNGGASDDPEAGGHGAPPAVIGKEQLPALSIARGILVPLMLAVECTHRRALDASQDIHGLQYQDRIGFGGEEELLPHNPHQRLQIKNAAPSSVPTDASTDSSFSSQSGGGIGARRSTFSAASVATVKEFAKEHATSGDAKRTPDAPAISAIPLLGVRRREIAQFRASRFAQHAEAAAIAREGKPTVDLTLLAGWLLHYAPLLLPESVVSLARVCRVLRAESDPTHRLLGKALAVLIAMYFSIVDLRSSRVMEAVAMARNAIIMTREVDTQVMLRALRPLDLPECTRLLDVLGTDLAKLADGEFSSSVWTESQRNAFRTIQHILQSQSFNARRGNSAFMLRDTQLYTAFSESTTIPGTTAVTMKFTDFRLQVFDEDDNEVAPKLTLLDTTASPAEGAWCLANDDALRPPPPPTGGLGEFTAFSNPAASRVTSPLFFEWTNNANHENITTSVPATGSSVFEQPNPPSNRRTDSSMAESSKQTQGGEEAAASPSAHDIGASSMNDESNTAFPLPRHYSGNPDAAAFMSSSFGQFANSILLSSGTAPMVVEAGGGAGNGGKGAVNATPTAASSKFEVPSSFTTVSSSTPALTASSVGGGSRTRVTTIWSSSDGAATSAPTAGGFGSRQSSTYTRSVSLILDGDAPRGMSQHSLSMSGGSGSTTAELAASAQQQHLQVPHMPLPGGVGVGVVVPPRHWSISRRSSLPMPTSPTSGALLTATSPNVIDDPTVTDRTQSLPVPAFRPTRRLSTGSGRMSPAATAPLSTSPLLGDDFLASSIRRSPRNSPRSVDLNFELPVRRSPREDSVSFSLPDGRNRSPRHSLSLGTTTAAPAKKSSPARTTSPSPSMAYLNAVQPFEDDDRDATFDFCLSRSTRGSIRLSESRRRETLLQREVSIVQIETDDEVQKTAAETLNRQRELKDQLRILLASEELMRSAVAEEEAASFRSLCIRPFIFCPDLVLLGLQCPSLPSSCYRSDQNVLPPSQPEHRNVEKKISRTVKRSSPPPRDALLMDAEVGPRFEWTTPSASSRSTETSGRCKGVAIGVSGVTSHSSPSFHNVEGTSQQPSQHASSSSSSEPHTTQTATAADGPLLPEQSSLPAAQSSALIDTSQSPRSVDEELRISDVAPLLAKLMDDTEASRSEVEALERVERQVICRELQKNTLRLSLRRLGHRQTN